MLKLKQKKNDLFSSNEIAVQLNAIDTFLIAEKTNYKLLSEHLYFLSDLMQSKDFSCTVYFLKMAAESIDEINTKSHKGNLSAV